MPIIVVSTTDAAARLLRYTDADKADQEDRGERVLHMAGIGCSPERAAEEFRRVWLRHGTEGQLYRGKPAAEARHVIVSFSLAEADPNDPDAVLRAFEYSEALTRHLWPGAMAKIVMQADGDGADGRGGKLHAHIVLNATVTDEFEIDGRVYRPGHKLGGPAMDIDLIRDRADAFMTRRPEFGFRQVLQPSAQPRQVLRSKTDVQLAKRGRQSQRDQVRSRIDELIADPAVTDLSSLFDSLATRGVTVELRGSNVSYRLNTVPAGPRRATGANLRGSSLGTFYTPDGLAERIKCRQLGLRAEDLILSRSAPRPPRLPSPRELDDRQQLLKRALNDKDELLDGLWQRYVDRQEAHLVDPYAGHALVTDPVIDLAVRRHDGAQQKAGRLRSAAAAMTRLLDQTNHRPEVRELVASRITALLAEARELLTARKAAKAAPAPEPVYRSAWRDVTSKDPGKARAIAEFDEMARRSLRSGKVVIESDVPAGLGPITLREHGDRFDPTVLALLHRRQESRDLDQELYHLAKTYRGDPQVGQWRDAVRNAMALGEYGAGSPAVVHVRAELEPWQEAWDAFHAEAERIYAEEVEHANLTSRPAVRMAAMEASVPDRRDHGFEF